ncbi:MAG: peptidase M16, partial [Verrucomicrobiaceae bacterium]|nr:peptidase M16 [Verrucomicrobiaceae bacterium]
MKEIKFPDLRTERFKLGNGLNVIVREDHSNPVVSLQAWCETGSIHEGKHLGTGVSHFVEHMVFKGTKHRESLCIAQDVSSIGGNINAYTSFDRTVYYIDSPANGIEKAIEILHDIVFQAIFPKKEFEPEREVIRREISMGKDDADKVASQEMFNTCYQKHPFGLPVIGYLDNFNSLSHSDVVEYYKDRYVPDNIFLVISGDVSLEKIRPKIQDFFEKPSRQISQSIYVPQEPMQLGRRDSFVNFTNPITRFWMAWKIPSITDKDTAAIDVMAV